MTKFTLGVLIGLILGVPMYSYVSMLILITRR